ncbi:probable trehalase [Impatiens glandulifera]|uniref:probable trehalase n=1 Tax=Impatiens glandulifera TaxID=253017 RepID=UPI001FB06417|nr:probable trehalase [Impatiens glandulifera]
MAILKIFSIFIFSIFIFSFILPFTEPAAAAVAVDSGPVVPTIPLVSFLERLQDTALNTFGPKNFDPKLYVDLSLKSNLSVTQSSFDKLPKTQNGSVSIHDLNGFIQKYLNPAEADLETVLPADFVGKPDGFLPKVNNKEVKEWALKIHDLWKNLSRKVADGVVKQPELHTLLPLPEHVVIPGSRFREVYYWDSYWVIRGLLASKMYETSKGIVLNLVSLLEKYGYVLNGARAYYTNRSQPPFLSSMIYDIYKRTNDKNFLKKVLPALIKEHEFWNSGVHAVSIKDGKGRIHKLSRYYAKWNEPRPESSTIDKETASKLTSAAAKQLLYREIASTAESGWDFSTRWMRNGSDLTTLETTSILPVDLNAIILKMEHDIAFLAKENGDQRLSIHFLNVARARKLAIESIFWNSEEGQWFDYWLNDKSGHKDGYVWKSSNQNKKAFASNFIPLWIKPFYSDTALVEKVQKSLKSSGLVRKSGIATTTTNSGQQWDSPNGWAPLQHLLVEGLLKSKSKESKSLARDIANSWLKTNFVTFVNTGVMHEKYNVETCGESGGGGEYSPQTGFGWSNGVVLSFLEMFGWPKDLKIAC